MAAVAVIVVVLRAAAASDVRTAQPYLLLYGLMGAAWLAVAIRVLPLVGISARDDVIERCNASATFVIAGALLGFALAFAGGNVGDGPGWWVVLFSSGVATLTLFALWLALEAITRVSETVTVDRDPAAGLRLAAFVVATGAICGRAAAGDWVSAEATLRDFAAVARPALLILVLAIVVERLTQPTVNRETPSVVWGGMVPALAYIFIAAVHLYLLGPA
jgi:uncharacterized membrane protein YjfL (UPF0719 family)